MSEPRNDESPDVTDNAPADETSPFAEPTAEQRIAELEARLRTVSSAYQQKVDEIALVRDRLERQARLTEEIRRGEVVQSFFEPVENLHRSIEAAKGQPVESGLRMVHAQFLDALKRLGLEEVPGVGAPFNADMHEALATQPVDDPAMDGKVVQVYATGYRIGSRLIRAARVIIGAHTPADA